MLLVALAGAVAAAQVLLEGRFERTSLGRRWFGTLVAGLVASSCTGTGAGLHELFAQATFGGEESLRAPSVTFALRWHLVPWMLAGLSAGWALVVVRQGRYLVEWVQEWWSLRLFAAPPAPELGHGTSVLLHLSGGALAGAAAALVWYGVGVYRGGHFFAAGAGCWTLGAVLGGVGWAVPDRLYRGWVRVLRGARPGWRIPVDHAVPVLRERFMGHFPVGMDLHLPDHDGVAELHVSVVAKKAGSWAARGLSRKTVRVRRPLEWMDLTYDPRLPAPLEAPLATGDRIQAGDGAEVEFIVLPREGES
jgi:hypothetical protein